MALAPRIVGFGGRSAAAPGAASKLDEYVLGLTGPERPKVLYLPTPAADADARIVTFYERFTGHAEPSHLKLFGAPEAASWRPRLLQQDAICVSGGNTANALSVWRTHGMDVALREAWEAGVILFGGSAGMICWFECSVTDSFGPALAGLRDGLGFLPGSVCPHYDGEERRRPVYQQLVASGFPAGFAVDEFAGIHFEGTTLKEVVTEVEGHCAYRVELVSGEVRETAIQARLLP
ncbi:MAG: Type 1 glutamine amidotransferase-like domain-containing protein [Candidatus Dormibacteraceae bacterium]